MRAIGERGTEIIHKDKNHEHKQKSKSKLMTKVIIIGVKIINEFIKI